MDTARHGGRNRPQGDGDAHAPGGVQFIKVYTEGLLDDESLKDDEVLLISIILSLSKNSRHLCWCTREHLGKLLRKRGDYVHRIIRKINRKYEAGKTRWRVHVTYRHLEVGRSRTNEYRVLIPHLVLARWVAQRDAKQAEIAQLKRGQLSALPPGERGQPSALSADNRPRLSADNCARNKSMGIRSRKGATVPPVRRDRSIPPLWRDPTAWPVFARIAAAGGDHVAAINQAIENREIVCFLHGIRWKLVEGARPHAFNPNLIVLDVEAGANPPTTEAVELLKIEMGQWVFLSAWPKGHFPT